MAPADAPRAGDEGDALQRHAHIPIQMQKPLRCALLSDNAFGATILSLIKALLANRILRIIFFNLMLLAAGVCGNLLAEHIATKSLTAGIFLLPSLWVSFGLLILSSIIQANLEFSSYRDRLREAVFKDLVRETKAAIKGSNSFLSQNETKKLLGLD